MADDKRNRGDQPQGGNQEGDRQRQRDPKPGGTGGGSIDNPDSSGGSRRQEDQEQE